MARETLPAKHHTVALGQSFCLQVRHFTQRRKTTLTLFSCIPPTAYTTRDLVPTPEAVAKCGKHLLIVADTIEGRVNQIRAQIEESTSDYDREKLQERVAKLAGGVAVIKVGAATAVEMKEKKARVEDALHATRAAVEEGIVPGGGVALLNAMSVLGDVTMDYPDEQTGVTIVRRALEEPMLQLAVNAGMDGAVIVENVRRQQKEQDDSNVGYDVLREVYVNMVKQGIIDPVKVTRSAVENAASIGAMILTTEALITDIPEPEPPMPPGGGGMPGMM